ncbi:MAG TPA: alanine--tRNA ligase [Firmicutes bacterium]|nr:alanine--tRNA ligase [Candidatus Fermentithermobacillaceae bacterium]
MEKLGKNLQAAEIRNLFLTYFERRGHEIVHSSSLVPYGDPTLLFTNAGMVQFKDVFMGLQTRTYSRAVTSQKCVRAGGKHNDLDNVGFTGRHHTFFEMLGNFSFGDYFKEDAIEYAWDFLTKTLELPGNRLWVTVFRDDDEADNLWKKIAGIPSSRIVRMGEEDNFWAMGETGPCGPCSEVIIDRGEHVSCGPGCGLGKCDCDRWLEIWNLVFMQYLRDEQGNLAPLPKPSIDTGMGLERITSVIQGASTNFGTDLFMPITGKVQQIAGKNFETQDEVFASRVIADHIKACTFLATDGVHPSNEGRGYVMRRILRRAVRFGRILGIERPFLAELVPVVVDTMEGAYPELRPKEEHVRQILARDEEGFLNTLEDGQSRAGQMIAAAKKRGCQVLPGRDAFLLYDTFGFPIDLTKDMAREQGLTVDEEEFAAALEEQRNRSRKARRNVFHDAVELHELVKEVQPTVFTGYESLESQGEVVAIVAGNSRETEVEPGATAMVVLNKTPFYATGGGQEHDTGTLFSADGEQVLGEITGVAKTPYGVTFHHVKAVDSGPGIVAGQPVVARVDKRRREGLKRHHTATHLLHKALKAVLGDEVQQAGSLVDDCYLRFDFNYPQAVSDKDIELVQKLVNKMIMQDSPVIAYEASLEDARSKGAIALFGEKYDDIVRVVEVPGLSAELCGGTHVSRTGEIGCFMIGAESSVAAGIRRIEAIAGMSAVLKTLKMARNLKEISNTLDTGADNALGKIQGLKDTIDALEREIENLKTERARSIATSLFGDENSARKVGNRSVIVSRQDDMNPDELRHLGDLLREQGASVVILGSGKGPRAFLTVMVNLDLASAGVDAVAIVKKGAKALGGSGGGKKHLAQAGGKHFQEIDKALEVAAAEATAVLRGI